MFCKHLNTCKLFQINAMCVSYYFIVISYIDLCVYYPCTSLNMGKSHNIRVCRKLYHTHIITKMGLDFRVKSPRSQMPLLTHLICTLTWTPFWLRLGMRMWIEDLPKLLVVYKCSLCFSKGMDMFYPKCSPQLPCLLFSLSSPKYLLYQSLCGLLENIGMNVD
jgi:hypothetical protein